MGAFRTDADEKTEISEIYLLKYICYLIQNFDPLLLTQKAGHHHSITSHPRASIIVVHPHNELIIVRQPIIYCEFYHSIL